MSAGEPPPVCPVVKDFLARQGIIAFAGLVFLGWTWVRVRRGLETRDVRTFAADTSKQAGQQAMGGAMMVVLGHKLAEDGFSPLAWYGALYPFEIVLTTGFTGVFRRLNEVRHAHEGPRRQGSRRYTSAPRRAFSGTRAAHFHREAVAKLGAAAGQCRPVRARRPVRLSVLVVRGAAAAGRLLAPGRVAQAALPPPPSASPRRQCLRRRRC